MPPLHERQFGGRSPLHLASITLAILSGLCCFLPACAQEPPSVAITQSVGSISGTVIDVGGSLVPGANIALTSEAFSGERQASADQRGRFTFSAVPPGKFTLTITADGLAPEVFEGLLHVGEADEIPEISLRIATANTDVEVTLSQQQVAEDQIKGQEKQRILGFMPNFYISYNWHAAPLTSKQKFELANKSVIDPISILIVAGTAGVQQWQNDYSGYGQGAQGYGKRFGAAYADFAIGTYLGGAILPSLFHEDPRYFYKGTGSKSSRALYALSAAVIARGDNGKWRPSYAGILGDMGAGAISNIYYPASDRNGASLTIENGLLSIASDAVGNLLQEFVVHKLSSGVPKFIKTKH